MDVILIEPINLILVTTPNNFPLKLYLLISLLDTGNQGD